MSTPTTALSPSRPRALLAAVLVVLTTLVTLYLPTAPASAAPGEYTEAVSVELWGQFTDTAVRKPRTGRVVGTVTSGTAAGQPQFQFSATCTDNTATPCQTTAGTWSYSWDFGDGTKRTTETPTTAHQYSAPGAYAVSVSVSGASADAVVRYSGTSRLNALVAVRYADIDRADPALVNGQFKLASEFSDAVWSVSAAGLMGACRMYFPDPGKPATKVPGERTTDPGRGEFCPQAPVQRAPSVPSLYSANGITGVSCMTSAAACGLPAEVFAANATTPGDPTSICTATCKADMVRLGLVNDSGQAQYTPSICEDNHRVTRSPGGLTMTRGVEDGCASYGEFVAALVRAVDGTSGPVGTVNADMTCPAGPAPSRDVRRARALWGDVVELCNTDAALTKDAAYTLLATAADLDKVTGPEVKALRDLTNPTLGDTPNPVLADLQASVGGALHVGAPLVGTLDCADKNLRESLGKSPGACFNPREALSRLDAANLLSFFLLAPPGSAGTLKLELDASAYTLELGRPAQVVATVTVPAYYPIETATGTTVTVSWPAADTVGGSLECPTGPVHVNADRVVRRTCVYTPRKAASPVSFPVSVTDSQGGKTSQSLVFTIVNDPPQMSDTVSWDQPSKLEGGGPFNGKISVLDPQGNPVSFGVRSCNPALDNGCASTAATFDQTGKARSLTSDSDPAAFKDLANTDAGVVEIAGSDPRSVTVRLNLHDTDVHGPYDFVVQACDSGGACTSRKISDTVTAVNDVPVPASLITAATTNSPVTATLAGSDPKDVGRPGYTGAIASYRITSLPARGTLAVKNTSGAYVPATVGITTTDPVVRWTPESGTAGTWNATYKVTDNGQPAPGAESSLNGQVQFTNTLSDGAPTARLILDSPTATALTDDVRADASASFDPGPAGIIGYTFDWGDGSTTGPQASPVAPHRYTTTSDRTYTVTVTVTDSAGKTDRTSTSVFVRKNWVANPTIENGIDRWRPYEDGTDLAVTTDQPAGGSQSLRVTRRFGTNCGIVDSPATIAATVTGQHVVRAAVRASNTSNGAPIFLKVVEMSGTDVVKTTSVQDTLSLTSWKTLTAVHEPLAADNTLSIQLYTDQGGTGCFDVDDIELTRPAGAGTYTDQVLTDLPLAYYKLDEPSGTVAPDSSGNGRNGAHVNTVDLGAAPLEPTSSQSAARYLKGTGADGSSTNLTGLGVDTAAGAMNTVEFWMQWDGAEGSMPFGFQSYNLYFAGGGFGFNTANSDVRGIPSAPLRNKRVHVVAVFNNGDATKNKIYIDGVEQPLTQILNTPAARTVTTNARISSWWNDFNYRFTGVLDEVAVYRGELAAARIVAHFDAGKAAPTYDNHVLADSPAGYYALEETTGTVATDSSPRSNNGTIGGAVTLGSAPVTANSGPAAASFAYAGHIAVDNLAIDTAPGGRTAVEFWMNWTGGGSTMPIGFSDVDLWFAGGGFGFNTASSDIWGIPSAGLANRRVHVVAVFVNGNVKANKLYIDGVEQSLRQMLGTTTANPAVSTSARISGWTRDSGNLFTGTLDSVAFYGRELAPERVRAHYAAGSRQPSYTATVAADRPVGHWRMNEAAGATAFTDSSGTGTNLAVVGTPTFEVAGTNAAPSATAARFTGQGQGGQTQWPTPWGPALTAEAWVRPNGTTGYQHIAGQETVWKLRTTSATQTGLLLGDGTAWTAMPTWPVGLPANTWSHVAVTASGTTAELFINGVSQGQRTVTWAGGTNGRRFVVSGYDSSGIPTVAENMPGDMADVAVYDRVLPTGRITAHYNAGR